jgi:hypothetical protein
MRPKFWGFRGLPVAQSVLPASKLGDAFNTILSHWEAFNVFVDDGALPIDNHQAKRLMKRIAAELSLLVIGRFPEHSSVQCCHLRFDFDKLTLKRYQADYMTMGVVSPESVRSTTLRYRTGEPQKNAYSCRYDSNYSSNTPQFSNQAKELARKYNGCLQSSKHRRP